jgi:hypothetical protein
MAGTLGRTHVDPLLDGDGAAFGAAVMASEYANGQTIVGDADGAFGTFTFGADGQPRLEDDAVADDDADVALAAEVAAYEVHRAVVQAEMQAADAAWTAEETARVYDLPVAGLHSRTDPMGNRMWAANKAWSREMDADPWQGLTLLDEGETSGRGAPFVQTSGATVLGFKDQRGGEWVAVGRGSDRDPDGYGGYTASEWEVSEVTGRYAQGLKGANGGYALSYTRFHRGPDRVTSPATVRVADELGPRWTPAYMTTRMANLGDSRYDEWRPAETITLFSESGHVLATKQHTYTDSTSRNGQAGVGLKLARKAGWTSALNIRVKDATFSRHDGALIPVSVKSADAYVEWLGDTNANGLPVKEWLDQGGLKAAAGCAAIGRQLMGPAAA